MNLFSGARRIAAVIAAFGVVLVVAIQAKDALDAPRVYYEVANFLGPARLVDECSDYFRSAVASERRKLLNGRVYEVHLCFLPSESSAGEMLIPYALAKEPGFVLMNSQYSMEVTKYTGAYLKKFGATEDERKAANAKYWENIIEALKGSAQWVVCWLAGWWIFVTITGWIARGFAGIPPGSDRRPPSIAP